MQRTLSKSIEKNVAGAFMLWRVAMEAGDGLRVDLARAILQECGYPGGEGAPSVAEAQAAIDARDGTLPPRGTAISGYQ